MKVLLLLLLAGLCSGIQYPLQYVYHYRAKVSSGIPDINKKHSAVSELKANLNVYVSSPTRIVFKLDDVNFGDSNGPSDCAYGKGQERTTPQPASPLGQFPFAVENGLLIFNSEEEQWAINFYKSIVSLFSIAPLKDAFYGASNNHSDSTAYDTTEDTVMGMCRTTYTQHRLSGVAAAQRELFKGYHIIEDVQAGSLGELVNTGSSKTTKTTGGRKTSAGPKRKRRATKRPPSKTSKTPPRITQRAPAISNTLWEVVRSVNLENCEDRVEHQHSLGGIYCLLSKDQCQNLFSRNSHGVYYLRGDENGMRLEKAMIKGAIAISPYGFETEHIETITKQILALVSVNHLDIDAPNLAGDSTVSTNELAYELTLPYDDIQNTNYRWAKMGTMKETIAALTGVYITEDIQQENERRVMNMVNTAGNLAASGNSEATQQAPVLLNYASILMYDFNKAEIARVAAGIQPTARGLFYGVLAEVGSAPAVDVMLDLIESGEVSALRQVLYFGSLNMNIKSATPLRPILNFLKSNNIDETPFKSSQSLINFASVVKRLCLGRRDAANSFQHFAYQRCVQDGIVADFQDYLISELQGASQFWKQMVFVQALVNLKSVEATNALLPYVLGARECDTMVRAVAMNSLAKWNAASPLYRSKIVLILLDILENPAENRLLRARALGYLASWELTSTEWTRLAFTTKRHGLKDLAAMTYSLIKSTAEYEHPEMIRQRQYARHALSLARPSSAADRYSSYKTWFGYTFDSQVGTIDHFSQVKDPMSPLPAEVAIYVQRSLGGAVLFRKMDFMIGNDNGDLEQIVYELFSGRTVHSLYDTTRGRWTNFLNMLKTDLNIEEKVRTAVRGMYNVIGASQTQFFIPFEREMLVDVMRSISGGDSSVPHFHLVGPSSLYINPIDDTFTTINDLGLPVITNVARPSVVSFKGSSSFSNSDPDVFTLGCENFGVVLSSFFRVNIETMIPWSHTKVAAGVSNTITVNLPVSPTLEFSWNDRSSTDPSYLIVDLAPSFYSKTALLTKVNMPYTLIRDTAPANLESLAQSLKIVYVNGEKGPMYQNPAPVRTTFIQDTYAGDFKLDLSPDFSDESEFLTLEELVLFPTLKFYSGSISADFTGMQTRSVRMNFTAATVDRLSNAGKLVSKYGQDSFEDYELCGHEDSADSFTQQTGQQSSDDYMYEQSSQSVQSPDQEFESFGSFGQQQAQVPAQLYDPTETETVRPSEAIGDVSQPQLSGFLNNLQRQSGWKTSVRGVSFRFEMFNGATSDLAYEAVAADTKCYALADQVLHKSVLVIAQGGDTCNTLCFETEATRPKINDLDTLESLLAKNLDSTRKLDIYTGKRCSVGPIQTINAKQTLSEAGREQLVEKLSNAETCKGHWGRPQDSLTEFVETAEYDHSEYQLDVAAADQVQCSSRLATLFKTQAWLLIRERIFHLKKSFQFCTSDNLQDGFQITGSAEKKEDGSWALEEHFGEKSLIQIIPALPYGVDDINKIGFLSDYHGHGDYCVIDGQKVTTFDGMRANFTAGACPVLVSTPCQEGEPDTFAVAVKTSRSGGLAVHVAGQVRQFIINVDAQGIDVNGVPMADSEYVKTLTYTARSGRTEKAGHLYKRNGFFKVEIDDTVDVLLKEGKVYIEVADRYRGYMCGLCGNYDNEPSNDLKAPNGCLITDSEQFSKAWTPSTGFDCFAEQQTNADTCLKEDSLPHDYYQQYLL